MAVETSPPAAAPSARFGAAFHRLWAAGALTNLGDGMLVTALPLVAATLTHDPLAVAGLAAARFLPWLLVAPLAGVLLDRVDRLRAMAVSNGVAAAVVALLALVIASGNAAVGFLYAALFLVVCCETVTDPATRITVAQIVPGRLRDRANGRLEGSRLIAQDCVAKPVAGVLFAVAAVLPVAGVALSYALCGVLAATVAALLRRAAAPVASRGTDAGATEAGGGSGTGQGFLRSLGEGFGHVLGHRVMRGLMFNNAATMIGMQAGTAVMVLYVQRELGVGAALYGVFLGAVALGGVAGSLAVARLTAAVGRRAVMVGGYAGMGVCLVLMGLFPQVWVAGPAWGLLGFCMTTSNIAGSLFFQTVVPDRLRGRVSAVFRTVGWGLSPLGALMGGLLGRIDLVLPCLVGGVVMVVGAVVFRKAIAEGARLCDEAVAGLAAENAAGAGPERPGGRADWRPRP
ncbi:MFS transporter [Nocardiopsis sp. CA-288880]|uniref:MFS transporter n=1 Tax=Nocardiopsis sp. CA-288880 TaxID=3239995 RepID=UPI003D97C663